MAARELLQAKNIQIQELSRRLFPCGIYYFQHDHRMFYNLPDCKECVMAHNNYIGSVAAKVYRFRENLLWNVNTDHYYDNQQAKFLTYINKDIFNKDIQHIDMNARALKNALYISQLLNRILILPDFRCCDCKQKICDHPRHRCSLLSVLRLKIFDSHFKGSYREHSFLNNSLVPDIIKQSISPLVYVRGFSIPEMLTDLEQYEQFAVINISAIYYPLEVDHTIWNRIEEAVECSDYEQWEPSFDSQQ
jgi:hypothetical protein